MLFYSPKKKKKIPSPPNRILKNNQNIRLAGAFYHIICTSLFNALSQFQKEFQVAYKNTDTKAMIKYKGKNQNKENIITGQKIKDQDNKHRHVRTTISTQEPYKQAFKVPDC